MRVDLRSYGLEPPDKSKTGQAAGQTPSTAPNSPETVAADGDQARITFTQARVQSLEAQALAQPEIREPRVEALRQAIHKNEYAVSDRQIAEAMVADLTGAGTAQQSHR